MLENESKIQQMAGDLQGEERKKEPETATSTAKRLPAVRTPPGCRLGKSAVLNQSRFSAAQPSNDCRL
jgi:hypothetical protein